jgi:hypothetical protein
MPISIPLNRRDWLRCSLAGSAGWLGSMAAMAAQNPARTKSVIVLWLNGGPSTIDLWDLKPGQANGGPFQETATTAPGLRISEHFSKLAKHGQEISVVRSMTSKEGDHDRATFLARTGYTPLGAIQFPAFGSVVAHELMPEQAELPGFVSITPKRFTSELGGGFLGPKFSPLIVGDGAADPKGLQVPNLKPIPGVTEAIVTDRMKLLGEVEEAFAQSHRGHVVDNIQAATANAVRLMRPSAAAAFSLDDEKEAVRKKYGLTVFGQSCLLARRLVERGVSFVEVMLDGWDTHQNNFQQVRALSERLDSGFATLLEDLKERGLLSSTAVVCMGEFGRTPKINGAIGRDHWPSVWSAVLAGGGIQGGRVVGKTSKDGTTIEEKPTTVPDLIATVCKTIGLDPKKQNLSNVGRPIRLADPNAKPIGELL